MAQDDSETDGGNQGGGDSAASSLHQEPDDMQQAFHATAPQGVKHDDAPAGITLPEKQDSAASSEGATTYIGGKGDPDEDEEAIRRRKRRMEEEVAGLQASESDDDEATPDEPEDALGEVFQRNALTRNLVHPWLLGIRDKDSYFKMRGKEMSDRQLRAVIMTATLEKGWTTLYFYKGDQIDPQLSGRAQEMVARLSRPGGPLQGMPVAISSQKMRDLEPWKDTMLMGPFRQAARHVSNFRQDIKDGVTHEAQSRADKLSAKLSFRHFKENSDSVCHPSSVVDTEGAAREKPVSSTERPRLPFAGGKGAGV